jgi:signal peptidase I
MQTFLFLILPILIVIAFFITPGEKVFRYFLNLFKVVAILFFVQSIVRIYWYDIYIVSSGSMERTIFTDGIIMIKKNLKENIERDDILLFCPNWDDKAMSLVKRCIGLPGDTLYIRQDTVFCNGKRLSFLSNYQWSYHLSDNIEIEKIGAVINRIVDVYMDEKSNKKFIYLTSDEKEQVKQSLSIDLVKATMPEGVEPHLYPYDQYIENNRDNNQYVYIPKQNDKIVLTKTNLLWYQELICKENPDIKYENNGLYLNDTIITNYTVKQNYYYMMGDNRHASQDSRYWGFIPRKNFIGKMVTVIN